MFLPKKADEGLACDDWMDIEAGALKDLKINLEIFKTLKIYDDMKPK